MGHLVFWIPYSSANGRTLCALHFAHLHVFGAHCDALVIVSFLWRHKLAQERARKVSECSVERKLRIHEFCEINQTHALALSQRDVGTIMANRIVSQRFESVCYTYTTNSTNVSCSNRQRGSAPSFPNHLKIYWRQRKHYDLMRKLHNNPPRCNHGSVCHSRFTSPIIGRQSNMHRLSDCRR